jgi:hypothetical protein
MKRRISARAGWAAAAALLCLTAAWAQDGQAPDSQPPTPSLGDLARQTRAQHTAQGQPSKAQDLVDSMQAEQEASENAPVGFKSYDAGDYRLLVPFPYTLEARDNVGPVLQGSQLGITTTEVLAGATVPIPPYINDASLGSFVQQIAVRYGSASCSPMAGNAAQPGSRKIFRCAINQGMLLGHQVSGSMEFIVASGGLIPIMCVSPTHARQCLPYETSGYQVCNQAYSSREDVQRAKAQREANDQEERNGLRLCDQIVYPSVQLKEDIVVHAAKIAEGKPAKAEGPVAQDTSVAAGAQTISPAEMARQTRAAALAKPPGAAENGAGTSAAPAGFQAFVLQYCQNPQQCAEAGVVIPEKAEIVSHVNGQHIFKTALDGEYALLYAGPADVNAPYRSLTDADWIRMRELANPKSPREKTDGVSTQEFNLDGRNGTMTRFRYQRDGKRWWVGERLLLTLQSGQFLLACTAPEEHFGDGEGLCATLVKSLRLP